MDLPKPSSPQSHTPKKQKTSWNTWVWPLTKVEETAEKPTFAEPFPISQSRTTEPIQMDRPWSPMSISTRTPSAMSLVSSTSSSFGRKKSSGYAVLDQHVHSTLVIIL